MASDRQQYTRALKKWDGFHLDGRYGVEPDEGVTAILCPFYGVGENRKEELDDYERLREDAGNISWMIGSKGRDVYLDVDASHDTFSEVIGDRAVSSIIVVGHGDLSSIYVEDGYKVDWRDISGMSTHLKRGFFLQRHCGQALRSLSVPLGLFSVHTHSSVMAPVGLPFQPELMTSTKMKRIEESKLRHVSKAARLSYAAIKHCFPGEISAPSES